MRKILYCNLTDSWCIEGHRYFDVKWANLLSTFADVTLLCPDEYWYSGVDERIKQEVYNPEEILDKKKIVNLSLWKKGIFRHLAIRQHTNNVMIIKKVLELDRKNHYDYIVASTIDLIALFLMKFHITVPGKLYQIQHQTGIYHRKAYAFFFDQFKNKIHHIVMESDAVEYMHREYRLEESRIHYIPHMLNAITDVSDTKVNDYDIVGISNSNDDNEIRAIIDLETEQGFFKKNHIHAIFRSQSLEFKDDNLTVFKGRLSLSYEEYYSYIVNAKIILLPFSTAFGLRSSGTIMDAFSNRKPIIGSPFPTMLQYQKQVPHICMTYSSLDELKNLILDVINRTEAYEEEYMLFCEEHSNENIIARMRAVFG